ncbi:MAG: hypothetical protein K2L14_07275 [Duncaniella sp.]|nr:hypothetical protein [Duncaniella sp.]
MMKKTLPYLLLIILALFITGCEETFNDNLTPSLAPNLTTPSEAILTVYLSDFDSDKNWDSADNNSADICIDNYDKDQDWNKNSDENDSANVNIDDYGNDQDWDNNEDTASDFSLGGWSDDSNWNN